MVFPSYRTQHLLAFHYFVLQSIGGVDLPDEPVIPLAHGEDLGAGVNVVGETLAVPTRSHGRYTVIDIVAPTPAEDLATAELPTRPANFPQAEFTWTGRWAPAGGDIMVDAIGSSGLTFFLSPAPDGYRVTIEWFYGGDPNEYGELAETVLVTLAVPESAPPRRTASAPTTARMPLGAPSSEWRNWEQLAGERGSLGLAEPEPGLKPMATLVPPSRPPRRPTVRCRDGATLSVQAGRHSWSNPRNDEGPYLGVEVGYPSVQPEPWEQWKRYMWEEWGVPTQTVYGFVPMAMVFAFIDAHGGLADNDPGGLPNTAS